MKHTADLLLGSLLAINSLNASVSSKGVSVLDFANWHLPFRLFRGAVPTLR